MNRHAVITLAFIAGVGTSAFAATLDRRPMARDLVNDAIYRTSQFTVAGNLPKSDVSRSLRVIYSRPYSETLARQSQLEARPRSSSMWMVSIEYTNDDGETRIRTFAYDLKSRFVVGETDVLIGPPSEALRRYPRRARF